MWCDELCVTVKYLSSVVKEKNGIPAIDFIEQYVITECKALLSSTTMTVQQIADELNFPSQSVSANTSSASQAYHRASIGIGCRGNITTSVKLEMKSNQLLTPICVLKEKAEDARCILCHIPLAGLFYLKYRKLLNPGFSLPCSMSWMICTTQSFIGVGQPTWRP